MTNSEAIKILQDTPIDVASTKQGILGLYAEALNMAIEALSIQPEGIRCKDCKHYQGEDSWLHCNRVTWFNGKNDFCSRGERNNG